MSIELTCPIAHISYFNSDTRRIILDFPANVDVTFSAGQYLEIILPDGKHCPFSIASPPARTGGVELHIKPTPDSDDSTVIEALLDDHSDLTIQLPKGDCVVETAPGNPIVLIAASTGITQMHSIIEHLAGFALDQPIALYWGVLVDADLYLTETCEGWARKFTDFHFVPVVSEPEQSPTWEGRTGLVGDIALEDLSDLTHTNVIVSGSPGMVYAVFDAFVARGMPERNMTSDVFSYAPRK
mgnify:CR=1 FL=1